MTPSEIGTTDEHIIPSGIDTLTDEHRIPPCEEAHENGYPPGTVLGNYLYLSNKASGVEPGFLAVFIDDAFCKQLSDLLLKKTDAVLHGLGVALKPDPEGTAREDVLKEWLHLNPLMAKDIANLCKENKNITRYLIKQDYANPGSDGKVTIPLARAKNSNTVKKIGSLLGGIARTGAAQVYRMGRKKLASEENRNALLECIGNEIASKAHGMQCQGQTVIFGTYPGGRLKILTRGTWDFGIEPLGEVHGGSKEAGNYLSIEVGKSGKKQSCLSDDSVKDLGEYFALMLTQGDVDAVGTTAQNKFKKDGKLFGLDFGQVYRSKKTVIDNLDDDFSFQQPTGSNAALKNFSIFEDTSLREKMKGIHYIRKLLFGENPSKETLEEYGTEFEEKIKKIEQGGDIKIFSGYMSKLNELHDEAVKAGNEALAAEYNDLMLEVGRTQANAIDINGKILKRFEQRLSLTPAQLDILEAFEKLSSETSLTSPDGTVLLNHMRVTKRVKCEMRVDQVDPDVIDSGVCTLTLGTPEDSHTTQQKLNDYIASHPVEFKELIKNKTIRRAKNGAIQFDKKDAEAVTAVFNEAMVQEHKHSKEVIRREELKAQLKIIKSDTETLSSPIAGSVSGPVTALPRVEGEVARLPSSAALPPIHIMAKEEVPVEQHRERSTTIHIMAKDVPGEQNEEISTTPRP